MALWGDAKLCLCILFVTCCCTVTLAQMPSDCCLEVRNKTISRMAIADYRQQESGQGCALKATVLVTRRERRTLCVPSDEAWVEELMKHVDHVKKTCKKHNYKGNRCFGVKPQ